jgi:hypothetical protein
MKKQPKAEMDLEQIVKNKAIAKNPNHSTKIIGRVEKVLKKFDVQFPPANSKFGTVNYTYKPTYKVIVLIKNMKKIIH